MAALVPWTTALLEMRSEADASELVASAFALCLETGNVDASVAAYRAHPPILKTLVAIPEMRDRLKGVLKRACDHQLAKSVGFRVPGPAPPLDENPLSKRENEVLDLLVQGSTNPEIAQALFLSVSTVKVHCRRIYRKLGVRSRTEAVVWALEERP